jgi:putative transcriptional regulator
MGPAFDYPSLVREIRQVRDLTQEQLAHELGVTFGTVNGWENGKHQPSPLAARELLRLAREAGVDVSALPGLRGRRSAPSTRSRQAGGNHKRKAP